MFIRYWAGLYQEDYQEDTQRTITAGVDLMMRTALKLLGKQGGAAPTLLIKDKAEEDVDRQEDA
jgi:hypothetical protein